MLVYRAHHSLKLLPTHTIHPLLACQQRNFSTHTAVFASTPTDKHLGKTDLSTSDLLSTRYASLRDSYEVPRNPIVLAHGLLGFEELRLVPNLPGLKYWRGITEALTAKGVEVIIATVPPSGSIEQRAERLAECIRNKAGGRDVNVIA